MEYKHTTQHRTIDSLIFALLIFVRVVFERAQIEQMLASVRHHTFGAVLQQVREENERLKHRLQYPYSNPTL